MLSSVLGVLAVIAFVAILIAAFVYRERVGKYVEVQMKTVGGSPKVFGMAFGGFVAWLLFLLILWLLSDMMPFWDWLTFHKEYFIALNLWLLAIALLWNTGGWARILLSLIGILLLFIAIVAGLAAGWERLEAWWDGRKSVAIVQQAVVAPPAPQKTVKRIVAPPADKDGKHLSERICIPPHHRFVLECNAQVWILPEGGKTRLDDCSPGSFGDNLPTCFRFQSTNEKVVPVTVSYWSERK